MGFLKRLFSRKHKPAKTTDDISAPLPKKRFHTVAGAPYTTSTPALQEVPQHEEDSEAAVHRLLRSSSARYAVAHEVDYSDLPPMRASLFLPIHLYARLNKTNTAHPINDVLSAYNAHPVQPQPTGFSTLHPSASTASLASITPSITGGSYNVKVYRKQRLSAGPEEVLATEKKKEQEEAHLNANDSGALRLRSEPSIVSLVSLYDEQGRVPDEVFNNSNDDSAQPTPRPRKVLMPVKKDDEPVIGEGRAQCKRSGSTLRQLLGASTNGKPEDASEGDISWAERFLGYALVVFPK